MEHLRVFRSMGYAHVNNTECTKLDPERFQMFVPRVREEYKRVQSIRLVRTQPASCTMGKDWRTRNQRNIWRTNIEKQDNHQDRNNDDDKIYPENGERPAENELMKCPDKSDEENEMQ